MEKRSESNLTPKVLLTVPHKWPEQLRREILNRTGKL
jgi:hypothetical protein